MDPLFLQSLLSFFVASVVVELTPGPNMAYLALLAANRGRLVGMVAVAGVALGLTLIGILAALGVSAIVESNRFLWELLRWGGVAYLLYLAWDTWRESRLPAGAPELDLPLSTFFRRGLVTNLLNPKAAVFYVAVVPSFTVEGTSLWPQLTLLTAIYVAVATLIHAAIVGIAGTMTQFFEQTKWRRRAGLLFAFLLVAVAVWLAVKTAR